MTESVKEPGRDCGADAPIYRYRVYGAAVCSDVPLLADACRLGPNEDPGGTTVILRRMQDDGVPEGLTPTETTGDLAAMRLYLARQAPGPLGERPRRWWSLRCGDDVCFYWREGEQALHYRLLDDESLESLAYWSLHVVVPMLLSQVAGYVFLHAAAVVWDGSAVLFMAPTMGGKSTLAAWLHHRGRALLADDKVRLVAGSDGWMACPAYPYARQTRGQAVLGTYLPGAGRDALPIAAVYLLERDDSLSAPRLRPCEGLARVDELLRQRIVDFAPDRSAALPVIAGLAAQATIAYLARPWGMEHLPALEALLAPSR